MRSLEQKVGQLLYVGFLGLEPPPHVLEWLASGRIGGVVLFARNIASPQQVAELTQACHEAAPDPIMIAIDQEGGTVARLLAPQGFTESPGAMPLAAANSPALAEQVAGVLAAELRALGINWNYAPMVDLVYPASVMNGSIGVRALGTDPARVTTLAGAQVHGYENQRVAATIKHFPGIGNTAIDSHLALPTIDMALDDLWERDLVPYRELVQDASAVMVGHIRFPAIDSDLPSTLSPAIVQGILRERIGFDGVALYRLHGDGRHRRSLWAGGKRRAGGYCRDRRDPVFAFLHARSKNRMRRLMTPLLDAAQSGRLSLDRLDEAVERLDRFKAKFAVDQVSSTPELRQPEHLAVMADAARAGVTLLKADEDVFPLVADPDMRVMLVEFAALRDSGVMEEGGQTAFASLLQPRFPQLEVVALKPARPDESIMARLHEELPDVDLLILATRNAHTIQAELAAARDLMVYERPTILMCLRNPYDVEALPPVDTVLCTCGDSVPSLQAAVDALLGDFTPTGELPVPLQ
jgi:beta-N-acetylhexosaminidase